MADYESVRQRIIDSVFSRRNAAGHHETYAAHLKIWEDAPEGGDRKPRYILLSQASTGHGFIHKSKLNANGTFSVGKTWRLEDLRGVEVVNPVALHITISRTYRWETEDRLDQARFIVALIRLFRSITGGAPLQLIGVNDPDVPTSSRTPAPTQTGFVRMERAPTPPNGVPIQTTSTPSTRRPGVNGYSEPPNRTSNFSARSSSPTPIPPPTPRGPTRSRPAPSPGPSIPGSPDGVHRTLPPASDRSTTPSRTRPITPSSQQPPPSALRTRPGRRPSNASSTIRASTSTTFSQVPSLVIPSTPTSTIRPSVPPSAVSLTASSTIPPGPDEHRMNGLTSIATALDVPSASSAASSFMTPSPLSVYPNMPETPRRRPYSPASSVHSKRGGSTTEVAEPLPIRRDLNNRISFYDPSNQGTLDRLLSGDVVLHLEKEGDDGEGGDAQLENAQATLTSVEEMLEGYEMASDDILGGKTTKGTADQIEARLLDELMALEKANIHSFIEADDRIDVVLKYLDEALAELDSMDSIVSSYKIHLNAVNDDINFIQSQHRGLQVQTQNQRALLNELEELLQTVQVDKEALLALTQESLDKGTGIPRLEEAATQLYKALQAGRDRDMAATMERLDEYKTHNSQFCKRIYDFLSISFVYQSKLLLGDSNGIVKPSRGRPTLKLHKDLEAYLGRYSGLMLYLKEMDEAVYEKLCVAYFTASSDLYSTQLRAYFTVCANLIKKPTEEEDGFAGPTPTLSTYRAAAGAGVRRAGTIVRSPLEGRRERKEQVEGDMRSPDAFALVLDQVGPLIYREQDFIADFLQINDAALTFADYMGLENYFRRQAARMAGLSSSTLKLLRGAMDLIFGFLGAELKKWLDGAVEKDPMQLIGLIVCLERFLTDAEERGNSFLINVLEKQHTRLKSLLDRRVNEHVKSIEDTKLTSKKRNGVAPFIKYFPTYIGRVEGLLIGADTLEIRQHVDQSYDRIVQAMFECLQQMAKMDSENEEKGQLNYHVILIENMHHFIAEISQLDIGSVASFLQKAERIYDQNLSGYVKIVMRRPFSRIIDYFEGVERLLKTTAPSEISSNSSYSKAALKKVVKDYTAANVRKSLDTLYKRVEKHFTEASEKTTTEDLAAKNGIAPGTVLVGVWKACEEEVLRITEFFSKRISQCYSGSGITLEYTLADVEEAFKKHRGSA